MGGMCPRIKSLTPTTQIGVSFQELPDAAGFLDREVELLFRLGGEVPNPIVCA